MNFQVKITERAEQDLASIFAYIATELCNPEAAEALLTTLQASIASLCTFPNRFPVFETPSQTALLRKLVVGNFLVFYTVDADVALVQVTSVLYAKRNVTDVILQN